MFMIPTHLFSLIDARWHEALICFIDTGDAPQSFLDFLDSDDGCQRVVEVCLSLIAQDVADFAGSAGLLPGYGKFSNGADQALASVLRSTVDQLLALDGDRRRGVLSKLGTHTQTGLYNLLHDVGDNVRHDRTM
jgi:hypothetical protein